MTASWRTKATCASDPTPSRWVDLPPVRIAGRNNPAYDETLAELKSVCATCPVAVDCLRDAIREDVRGVFAGTDEYERADLRDRFDLPSPAPLVRDSDDCEGDTALSARRFTALRLARRGLSNTEIATEMGVSSMTISRLTSDLDHRDTTPTNHTPAATRALGADDLSVAS